MSLWHNGVVLEKKISPYRPKLSKLSSSGNREHPSVTEIPVGGPPYFRYASKWNFKMLVFRFRGETSNSSEEYSFKTHERTVRLVGSWESLLFFGSYSKGAPFETNRLSSLVDIIEIPSRINHIWVLNSRTQKQMAS